MWNYIRAIFNRIAPTFKASVPVLLIATFVLLNVAIWWAGPWLEIDGKTPLASTMARAVTSIIFSLCCFTVWGIFQWRRLQQINDAKAREEILREDPIKRLEERQELELNQVMMEMKDSLNQRNYLYALPWYLVLGLENAGKTSLINRSGQNFVFSSVMRASGKKSENPFSFDWWIGDDSVLIDPDGELLTQRQNEAGTDGEMERRLWLHFVQWLEKTRSRRPLNGVILTLDLSHLATVTVAERQAYANLLRARLRELMETLSTRMPVYIALTKLDLLYGFEPFFRQYTRAQREEVMGFTFSLNSVTDLDSWLAEFDRDYSQFIERINDSLPQALRHAVDSEERSAIYSFTRQIAGMHDVLKAFFTDALSSDQFSTSALVRGAYFMSVYQQGVPENAFVNAASQRYGLADSVQSAQHAQNSTTYFVKRLFNEIIYPEAGIASDNFRVAKQKKKILMLSVVACSIASVLLIGSWHRYYMKNVEQENAVLAQVNQYKSEYSDNKIMRSEQEILEPLNTIREATLEFGFFRDKPKYVSDMGLYQGHVIGPKVEETYLSLLEFRYLPSLMKQLAVDLSQANSEEEELETLRVFRMLTDKGGRQDKVVTNYFAQVWQQAFPNNVKTQEQLMEHLNYALMHTDLQGLRRDGNQDAIRVMRPYDHLIQQTQEALGSVSIAERVYRNLKQSANAALGAPLDLKTAVGPVFDLVFEQRVSNGQALDIPQLLTQKGFNSYFLPQSESVSELALVDSWVLGQTTVAQFSLEDKQVLRQKIRDLYVADYTNTWRSAINDVDVKYFADINEAVSVFSQFMGPQQPMNRLLNTVEKNTQLFPNLPQDDKARLALMESSQYKVAAMIALPFADIDSLLAQKDQQPAYISEVMSAMQQVYSYLKAIQDAPDMGKAALEATKERVELKNSDPIYTLQRMASSLPKPLDSMMEKLADESWYAVKQEAIKYLEVRWQHDVYQEYQAKLATRYPFNPRASKDVSLKDFESFFAPDGTLNRFYNDQLKMFIDENISMSVNGQQNALLRSDVLKQFTNAKKIQEAFFNRKGILDVEFSLEPIELSSNQRRSVINVDGQYVEYSHGPHRSIELVWPNTLREGAISKLSLVPSKVNESPRGITIQGPWAFFRLLDRGAVVSSSSTSVDYQFSINGGEVTYRLTSEADANPFTSALFRNFKLTRTLY
ncbi:type VI secretion system membrane subunit TssM [Photobacterium damselae]